MEEESEKKEAKKQLMMSSGKKKAAGFHFRSLKKPGRRWPFSTPDLDVEETAMADGGAAKQLLNRSYSSTAGDDGDGGVKNSKQAVGGAAAPGRKAAGGGVGARLSRKLKEQRARIYIVRRCVAMLVCWRDIDN